MDIVYMFANSAISDKYFNDTRVGYVFSMESIQVNPAHRVSWAGLLALRLLKDLK